MKERQKRTDSFLIMQYRSGITSVLPILVKRHHKAFCEKAYWITKNRESAKDIAQESWITIINKIHSLENVDSFKSWAYRIVYTKAIDFIKRNKKIGENLKSVGIGEDDEKSVVDNKTVVQISLLKAIQELPKDKQDVIRLFYTEEYSINEISTFLKIPVGTVKSRLFKAREKLKSILKTQDYEK